MAVGNESRPVGRCDSRSPGWVGMMSGAWLLAGAPLPVRGAAPPEWLQTEESLVTVCQFADFAATVAFVERLVEPADRLGHHPDLAIACNRLTIR